ncbi:C4b-binding protein alpha chain-like [Aquarana catesbeiana]|uniref:C4b-binding protein alpha chain-like n=1 Tax=Aquarana catesbeiana TaxID=8400 RepID=UPI003CCA4D1E
MFPQKNIVGDHWGYLLLCLSAFIAASYGNCGAPLRLDFAIVGDQFIGQDNFPVGANVTYTCIAGYIRVPGSRNVIYCLSNSTWSTPETFCRKRSCGDPGEIANGDVHIDDTLFGSRVNYTCHIGYNMISRKNYRDCQADGTWSNEVPVCEVQICPPPNAITNGSFSPEKEDYVYQDVVTYQCNENKIALIGQPSIFCTSYGNWSSDAPKCVAVECSSPDVANARKLSGFAGPYYYNFAVTFECLKDFVMKGANSVKCNASSQWDPPLPTCYVPSCAPPNAITNGSFSPVKGEYAYQDVVTYQCNEAKFALIGQHSIVCTSYGNWSSDAPKCVVPSCAPPNAITNGLFRPVKGQYAYKDVVTYQCNENTSSLIGQPSIVCTSYGNWSSAAPECVGDSVADVMGNSIVILTMILMGHVISHHF